MAKLSVITINRNNAAGLRKTIESVISQTFINYEYIIIDGGSTDGSVDIIKQYADKITYWVSEPDTGIYNAMNKGIKVAKGEYLQFLNSGDWLYSNTVLDDVFKLDRTEDILYGSEILYYQDHRCFIKTYPTQLTGYFFYVGSLSHQATFHKATLFDALYSENYKIVSDWEFYIQKVIISNCSTYYLDKIIIYFDMTGISQIQTFETLQNNERKSVLEKYFPNRIMADYEKFKRLEEIAKYSLYPYVQLFSQYPKLQRIVRRFMKLLLILAGKKHLIPHS
jgi:glycosyltransferase involved in cell wall biosynthesis